MNILSAKEYAAKVGVTDSYIVKILKKCGSLPLTSNVEKYGNTWRIAIAEPFDAVEANKLLKTYNKN